MNTGSIQTATGNQKTFRLLGYLLVFLMMVCAVMTVGNLIYTLIPQWHSGIIASVMLFIVIDRLYTYRYLKTLTFLSSEWAIAIGGQWVLIVLVIRLLLSYANGIESLQADLARFARGEIAVLFTPELVGSLLFAFLFWIVTERFLDVLDQIGLDQVLASEPAPIQIDVVPGHQRLVTLTFSIGIGLVVLTALARVDYRNTFSNVEGIPSLEFTRFSGAEAGALLYFVFGLALLSLSRLMSLQTHWNQLRIPVSSRNLYRQWGIYSLFFLLSLAVIVSLLPAGDSIGFFSVLGTLFDFLISALLFVGQLIISLIMLVLGIPFFLFGGPPPILQPSEPPPMPVLPPAPQTPPPSSSPTWALVRSIFLWALLVVILIVSIIQFARQHGGIRAALRQSRITNWLMLAWQWLYRSLEKTGAGLARAITDGWQGIVARFEGNRILSRPNLIRLRSLDPRRQVYFFYLAMIRRGAEQGIARKPSQTPSEYAATLEKALPSAGEDIDSMTRAFTEARYSRQEVDASKANTVKEIWSRIRRAFQNRAKEEQFAKK